jgi:IS5 family transposase
MRGHNQQQLSFGEGFLDPSLFELDEELQRVDEALQDRTLLRPFEEVFHETMGRPGTDVGLYLRMMYLKFRWGLSYEEVEREVRERLPWRYFCHLTLTDRVPDATTLIKLNQRFGEQRVTELNRRLIQRLVKHKALRPRRIRIDSTTVEAHIEYPTDVGLLHQTVKTLTRTGRRLGHRIRSHVRATKRAVARLGASLKNRGKGRFQARTKTLQRMMKFVKDTVAQCRQALQQTRPAAAPQKRFEQQVELAERILKQTEQKLAGVTSIPERIVSFHDPAVRVIRKGKLDKPNEFGRTLQLVQDASGVILDYQLHEGHPSDCQQLVPLVKAFKRRFHRAPLDAAADKGYYSAANVAALQRLGVQHVGIPKLGRLKGFEKKRQRSKWFRRLYRFRCGVEASISQLKRMFGLGRALARGSPGTAIWVGFGILSYNLWQQT